MTSRRPPTLVGAAVVVALQGVGMLVLAVIEVATTSAGNRGVAITSGLFFALVGIGLFAFARGLVRFESWARGPIVAAELIELLMAYSFWGGETTAVAVVLAVVAIVALACVFAPPTTRALAAEDGSA